MKVLCVNKFYFVKGGSERYMFDATELLESMGHQVVPFAMRHEKNEESRFAEYFVSQVDYHSNDSVEKLRGAFRMLYSIEAARKIRMLAERERPNVSHLHNIAHQISPSILGVLRGLGIRTVMTAHDFKLICPNYRLYVEDDICNRCKGSQFYNAFLHKCMMDSSLASAMVAVEMYLHKALGFYDEYLDVIIAPSEFMKQKLMEFGVDEGKIELVRHFARLEDPPSERDDGFILYAGRLEKEKGVDLLIGAMGKCRLPLKIAGDGGERSSLEKRAGNSQARAIEFLGVLPGDEVAELLRSCSFVVVPSRWYENAPMIVYESLSAGKPVVGADVGGIPELVLHERNGLVFERGSVEGLSKCLESLSTDSEMRRRMGREARFLAEEELSPQVHVEALERIYAGTVS